MTTQPPHTLLGVYSVAALVALATNSPEGCFVEVGVYKGGTAWHLSHIARAQGRTLHLFDTFTGIPNQGPEDIQHRVGDFGDTSYEAVKAAVPDAEYHVGVFPGTMPPRDAVAPVGFVHVDCDQYAGVKACIVELFPLLTPGGVMLFDDYHATSGCTKAVDEAFAPSAVVLTGQGKAYVVKGST